MQKSMLFPVFWRTLVTYQIYHASCSNIVSFQHFHSRFYKKKKVESAQSYQRLASQTIPDIPLIVVPSCSFVPVWCRNCCKHGTYDVYTREYGSISETHVPLIKQTNGRWYPIIGFYSHECHASCISICSFTAKGIHGNVWCGSRQPVFLEFVGESSNHSFIESCIIVELNVILWRCMVSPISSFIAIAPWEVSTEPGMP